MLKIILINLGRDFMIRNIDIEVHEVYLCHIPYLIEFKYDLYEKHYFLKISLMRFII